MTEQIIASETPLLLFNLIESRQLKADSRSNNNRSNNLISLRPEYWVLGRVADSVLPNLSWKRYANPEGCINYSERDRERERVLL